MNTDFQLPPYGSFEPNDERNDPLKYYYHPLVGKLYRKRIQDGLALLVPPYGSILEIGYGSGLLLPSLCRMGKEVFGIDITSKPEKVRKALEKLGVKVKLFKGDINDWDASDQSLDLVVAFFMFEHIAEPDSVLQKVHKLMRTEGVLLVGMPRVDKIMAKLFLLIGFSGIEDHHVTTYHDFLKHAQKYFNLISFRRLPSFSPQWAGLYYNMLFRKK